MDREEHTARIEEQEQITRERFEAFIRWRIAQGKDFHGLQFTEPMCRHDGVLLSGRTGYSVGFEIKIRNYSLNSFASWQIEQDKYEHMMNLDCDLKLYVCILKDAILLFDLDKHIPSWRIEKHNKTTTDLSKGKKDKSVDFIPTTQALHVFTSQYIKQRYGKKES